MFKDQVVIITGASTGIGKTIFRIGRFLPVGFVDRRIYRNFAKEPHSPLP